MSCSICRREGERHDIRDDTASNCNDSRALCSFIAIPSRDNAEMLSPQSNSAELSILDHFMHAKEAGSAQLNLSLVSLVSLTLTLCQSVCRSNTTCLVRQLRLPNCTHDTLAVWSHCKVHTHVRRRSSGRYLPDEGIRSPLNQPPAAKTAPEWSSAYNTPMFLQPPANGPGLPACLSCV